MLECSAADYLKSLYLPLLASLVMLASLAAFRAYVFPSTSVVAFGSSILVGLVSYSCVMAAFEFGLGLGLRQVASRLRSAT
jgi:hypothetical protein